VFETMDLIANLPKAVDLNPSTLTDVDGKLRLSLGISHVVSGEVGATERIGSADIIYILDFSKDVNLPVGLDRTGTTYIGVQSVDFIHQQLQQLRPRTSYSVEHVSNGKFDFRSFMFVLGATFASGAAQVPVTFSSRASGYKTLNTGWLVPDVGDVTIGPNLAQNANQFVTLLALFGEAGVDNVTVLSDYVPGTTGNVLTGRGLAKFSWRLALNVLNSAQECLCFGSHFTAFFAGMTSVVTLNAHTDEGGWIRQLFRKVRYPRSTGIVSGMGREFIGFPLQESIPGEDTLRVFSGLYLSTAALIHPADVLVNSRTSVYERTEVPTQRICDFGTLTSDVTAVMNKWRDLICDQYGQHHDASSDLGAYYNYLRNPGADRHMDADLIVPFFWVETAPLITMDIEGYWLPARLCQVKTLPLFAARDVQHTGHAMDSKGRIPPHSSVWLVRGPTTFREEGASYLLSSAYSPDNGLAQFVLEPDSEGRAPPGIAFVDDGNANLANMRWVTPHNPMPCPVEGMSLAETTFRMHSVNIRLDPTPDELLNGTVESRLSSFFIKKDAPVGKGRTHKDVPPHIRRALKVNGEDFSTLKSLGVISLRGASVPARSDALPDSPDQPGVKTTATETLDPDLPEPSPARLSVEPSDSGVKPVMPSVKTPGKQDDQSGDGH
jgi:hypothetical protein